MTEVKVGVGDFLQMFFDLNLPVKTVDSVERSTQILELMIKFGYYGVAFNHIVEMKTLPKNAADIKLPRLVQKLLPTKTGPIYEECISYTKPPPVCSVQTAIRQFTRITVVVEDTSTIFKLTASNPVLLAYDLVAVQPTTEKVFQIACKDSDVDIITIDMSTRLPFYFKHSTVGTAIQRGVYFEICYSASIKDASARRNLISNARSLIRTTRGKNIIISSEASRLLDLRSPQDVMSIAMLFGISRDRAREAVAINPLHVLYHAHARKHVYRSAISVDQPEVVNSLKRKAENDV